MQSMIDRYLEDLETKEDNIKIQKREISILQNEQDKLLKEIKRLQDLYQAAQA